MRRMKKNSSTPNIIYNVQLEVRFRLFSILLLIFLAFVPKLSNLLLRVSTLRPCSANNSFPVCCILQMTNSAEGRIDPFFLRVFQPFILHFVFFACAHY